MARSVTFNNETSDITIHFAYKSFLILLKKSVHKITEKGY